MLKRKNKELATLNSIAGILSRSLMDKHAIQEALFRLLDYCPKKSKDFLGTLMLGMDDGGIFLIDERTNELVCYLTDRKLPYGDNLPSFVIESGSIHCSSDLLIHEIKKILSSMLNRKRIQLETFVDDNVKCFIGDREKLKQLLLNLVSNAINYSDEASKIDINIRQEGNHLLIKVSDTGWGIPDEDIPHMAKKFYRGKHGLKIKGTGLGLALCKEIAKLHGGDISITSRLGKGTTVTVDLPFEGNGDE